MGKIRTSRSVYQDRIVVDFKIKDKEVIYIVYKWNDDGTVRSSVDTGKLGDQTPQQIMQSAQQNFQRGIRN